MVQRVQLQTFFSLHRQLLCGRRSEQRLQKLEKMKTFLLLVLFVGAHAITCPDGFTFLPSTGSCYKVIFESHDWYSAAERCKKLNSRGMTAITSPEENSDLKKFVDSEISNNPGSTACGQPGSGNRFWTSGQQKNKNDCASDFAWKITSDLEKPFIFTNWAGGEPKCGSEEICVNVLAGDNFDWQAGDCNLQICPLCEHKE